MTDLWSITIERGFIALLVALAALAIVPHAAGADQRTKDILPFFNDQRTRNGLPAITEINAKQELGCRNHLQYIALNGAAPVHGEDPSKPGYTAEGDFLNGAGGSEVLAFAPGWAKSANPWATAPIHLYLLLNPAVVSTGYADNDDFACQRMSERSVAIASQTFYAWTGSFGRANVPYRVKAAELPYTPQQLVGIPADRTTGPNLMVFSAGNLGTPLAASLMGPKGHVNVRLVNENTKNSVGNGSWVRGGGIIIPTAPLASKTVYVAVVSWANQGQRRTQTFAFQTTSTPKRVSLRLRRNGRYVTLRASKRARGQEAIVRVTGRRHDRRRTLTLEASQRIRLPARSGSKRVRVTVRSFVLDGQAYRTARIIRRYR